MYDNFLSLLITCGIAISLVMETRECYQGEGQLQMPCHISAITYRPPNYGGSF